MTAAACAVEDSASSPSFGSDRGGTGATTSTTDDVVACAVLTVAEGVDGLVRSLLNRVPPELCPGHT